MLERGLVIGSQFPDLDDLLNSELAEMTMLALVTESAAHYQEDWFTQFS